MFVKVNTNTKESVAESDARCRGRSKRDNQKIVVLSAATRLHGAGR